ncbi:unnamed protein product [Gongylonema pulchrum]|uniref:Peptidase_M13 domain-containing protein n=1 Tax=Gongylonema pulchrum TaxID=637853 RepID=A0A183EIF0_9BILA|nr:unnamed protein product [Gongylonema pulchrum]
MMSYFEIVETFQQFESDSMFENLLIENERNQFSFPPPSVNAIYLPTGNQIALFVGILQGAFFNLSLPLSMNYGAIGAVIGHEITHGFDDTGRRYNAVGELDDWWDNKTLGQFMELKKCFVEQYGSIVEPGTGGLKVCSFYYKPFNELK